MKRRPFNRLSFLIMFAAIISLLGMMSNADETAYESGDRTTPTLNSQAGAVPEPTRALLMLHGMAMLLFRRRRD